MIFLKILLSVILCAATWTMLRFDRERFNAGWMLSVASFMAFIDTGDSLLVVAAGIFAIAGSITNLKRRQR